MVPMGPHAMIEGHLVHTNEITVHLGEGIFAKRSVSQAIDIIDRRLVRIRNNLKLAQAAEAKVLRDLDELDSEVMNGVLLERTFSWPLT